MYSICPSLAPVISIKYADDTVFIEILSKSDASQTDTAAHDMDGWCHDNDLVLNVSKTKELLLSNLRDNPVHDSLIIDGNSVEQVDSFKYLGIVINNKLRFQEHSVEVVKKAQKRLNIMKKLYAMHVSVPLQFNATLLSSSAYFYTILVLSSQPLGDV